MAPYVPFSLRTPQLQLRTQGEEVRRAAKEHRRVAAAADALEDVLFALFCRQSQWSFPALQKETKQPAPHLKSVLDKVRTKGWQGWEGVERSWKGWAGSEGKQVGAACRDANGMGSGLVSKVNRGT